MKEEPAYKSVDRFDVLYGGLANLPDVTKVKPSPITVYTNVIGAVRNFTVQTMRQADKGDTIFIQCLDSEGSVRLVIPPEVAEVIARQRDALSAKNRKRAAKERAAKDKAAGVVPGFMRNGAKRGKRKKKEKES